MFKIETLLKSAIAVFVLAGLVYISDFSELISISSADDISLAAWQNIGGCGGGGGGGVAGAGKWIGRSPTGGLYNIEILKNTTIGGDYQYNDVGSAITTKIGNSHTIGVSLAWRSMIHEKRAYKTATDLGGARTWQTAGFGDLGLTYSLSFGDENEYSFGINSSIPTGQHDIKRLEQNNDASTGVNNWEWINPNAQPGTGLYSLGASFELSKDLDIGWGEGQIFVMGGSFTSQFGLGRNYKNCFKTYSTTDVKACQDNTPDPTTWKLWDLKHRESAPGTGNSGADALSVYAHFGVKESIATQSGGVTFSIPLNDQFNYEQGQGSRPNIQGEVRTRDFTMKLSYGLEVAFLADNFPIFFAAGIPWKLNPKAADEWSKPQNYVFTAGIKGTFL